MMKTYQDWLIEHSENKKSEEVKRPKIKKDGSVDVDQKIAKKLDLITLPANIKGTNCGNCEYYEKSGDMGFCDHEKVLQWVTPRMCCCLWDTNEVQRPWGKIAIQS